MAGRDSPQSGPEDANAPGGSLPGGKPAGRSRKRTPTAWFGTLSQLDFDIDFFERLLARKADSVEVLRILAELVSKRGLVNRAVALDRRLVELLPDDFLARYNLACSLARAGQSDEAIDSLSRAILLGYDDLAHMESDPDLESLKSHPDFQALLGSE
ncbi:MAG: TPR end-of-group domain-containing protein [Planctomycetia bacterium]|jgi:tetratricopeptide (TPR) repeat protein